MSANDGGAAALAGGYAWDSVPGTMHRDAGGTWTVDGVKGVPDAVVARMVGDGEDFRLPTFGRVLRVRSFDFGSPAGVCLAVLCEKWVGVYRPTLPNPIDHVQGVLLAVLPALLAVP